ncbi:hypothetical protein FRC00_002716 [Tulasnella sp. 408]|nr:hypothetical protein FRC00_002716 [Tulasnella sp. 408]
MPALETLELRAPPWRTNDSIEPLGNFPSIRHLKALWWQPPADTAWLLGLKELVLWRTSPPDAELLRVLSACANLEFLDIFAQDDRVGGERSRSISPVTLPRLRAISLDFESNEAVGTLIRGLIIPQCLRRTLCIRKAPRLSPHVADYRSFMSMEGSCNWQPPKSASILIKGSYPGSEIEYKTGNCKISLNLPSGEEVPAFHELVQEFQSILKGPCLTVTIKYPSGPTWLLLQSLGHQNIRVITVDWEHYMDSEPWTADLLKIIGVHSANLPDRPITNTAKDRPFESLTTIDIHNAYVNLNDVARLAEEYLHKNSKPLLREIVLVDCCFTDMELAQALAQAVKRLVLIGITLRNVTTPEED